MAADCIFCLSRECNEGPWYPASVREKRRIWGTPRLLTGTEFVTAGSHGDSLAPEVHLSALEQLSVCGQTGRFWPKITSRNSVNGPNCLMEHNADAKRIWQWNCCTMAGEFECRLYSVTCGLPLANC